MIIIIAVILNNSILELLFFMMPLPLCSFLAEHCRLLKSLVYSAGNSQERVGTTGGNGYWEAVPDTDPPDFGLSRAWAALWDFMYAFALCHQKLGELDQLRKAGLKEDSKAPAITVSGAGVASLYAPLAIAAVSAERIEGAASAFLRYGKRALDEIRIPEAPVQIGEGIPIQVPKAIGVHAVKVTGIDRAVRLDGVLQAAVPQHITGLRRRAEEEGEIVLKDSDMGGISFLKIVIPKLKELDQHPSVGFRAQVRAASPAGSCRRVQTGDILLVETVQTPVALIDFRDPGGAVLMDDGEEVEIHAPALQQAEPLEDTLIAGGARELSSVSVVTLPDSVQGQADEKIMLFEKAAPGFIQQKAVCLEAVLNPPSLFSLPFLQLDQPLIKGKSPEQRLSALKTEEQGIRAVVQCPFQDIFQCFFRHDSGIPGASLGDFIPIEAIGAVHIAKAGDRLQQKGEHDITSGDLCLRMRCS